MHRSLVARAIDNTETPVPLAEGAVTWKLEQGSIENGVLAAPQNADGPIAVEAADGSVHTSTQVRVLNPVKKLELSTEKLSIAEPIAADAVVVSVTGRDDEGYSAAIEPEDLNLEDDHSVVEITPRGRQAEDHPTDQRGHDPRRQGRQRGRQAADHGRRPDGGSVLVRKRRQRHQPLEQQQHLDHDLQQGRGRAETGIRGDAECRHHRQRHRQPGESRRSAAAHPVQTQILDLRPRGLTYLGFYDGNGVAKGIYGNALEANASKWQYAEFALPANTVYPITISSFQGINTSVALQKAG